MNNSCLAEQACVLARIRRAEGFSRVPYKCSAGRLTVGYGHNLEHGISVNAAEFILREDVARAERQVKDTFPWWTRLTQARLFVLVDMCFNMGLNGLKGFKKMLAALEAEAYETAAGEMLKSRWAAQVGRRARENARLMRSGKWE